jgi:PAS domain S-box-containing protein
MSLAPWSDVLARMMFEQSPFSSVLYDAQGRIIAVNKAFEALWGVDISSAPPDYSVLEDPELARQGALPVIRRAFAGEAVMTPAVRYDISKLSTTGTGSVRWVQGHFYPLLDEAGAVRLVMLTHFDLTDRTEAEIKLRYAVADLQTLQGLTAGLATAMTTDEVAGIMLDRARPAFGAGGGFVTVLEGDEFAMIRFTGFDETDIGAWRRFPVSRKTASADAVRTGEPVFVPTIDAVHEHYPVLEDILRKNGYVSFASIPLRAHGRVLGTVVFHFNRPHPINATQSDTLVAFAGQCALAMERAQLYESERAARADAESANRAKSQFLATMSHELRTPLNAIDGYAELLEMGIRGPLNQAQLQDLERIRRSQKHLLSLIDDLLNFARIESGSVALNVDTLSVSEAINAAHDIVAPQVAAKGLHFYNRAAGLDLAVAADPAKLHQILLNLLANAIKFTETGGITIVANALNDDVVIEVQDTGRGIPQNRLEDIFQPFVQVDSGMTRTTAGTGLGLAIARDLARRMRGDVAARSIEGEGSTFIVTLPRAADPNDGRSS